jgi:hypothetical protein
VLRARAVADLNPSDGFFALTKMKDGRQLKRDLATLITFVRATAEGLPNAP